MGGPFQLQVGEELRQGRGGGGGGGFSVIHEFQYSIVKNCLEEPAILLFVQLL